MDPIEERKRYEEMRKREWKELFEQIESRNIQITNEMWRDKNKYLFRGSNPEFVEYLKKIIKDHDDEQAAAKLRGPPEDPIGKLNVIQWKQDHEKKTGAAGLKVPLLYRAGKQNIICDDAYWRKMLGKCVYRKHYHELKQ